MKTALIAVAATAVVFAAAWLAAGLPVPRLPRLPRVRRRRRDGGRLAWKLWSLACKHPRVCPANAHGALIWRTRPLREIFTDSTCLDGNDTCWCGKLRAQEPGTAPATLGDGPGHDEHWAARGRHGEPLRLRRGLDGLLHDPDTGTFTAPAGYGLIPPGTRYDDAARLVRNAWGWP